MCVPTYRSLDAAQRTLGEQPEQDENILQACMLCLGLGSLHIVQLDAETTQ